MLSISTTRPAAAAPKMNVFDASSGSLQKVSPAQINSSKDAVLREIVTNASRVMEFLQTNFGRDGLDGKGRALKLVVHAPDPHRGGPMSNAYWDGDGMYVGDGGIEGGQKFGHFGKALDLLAHEIGHAVLESEVKMGFNGQEGALHESFGDVIGSLLDTDDWKFGEDTFLGNSKPGFRDMENPTNFKNMKDVTPNAKPHDLADIPNLAAVKVAKEIGRESMGKIWYEGFTSHLPDNAKFSEAARATVTAAEQLFGAGSKQASAVNDAWTSVGVLGTTPAPKQAPGNTVPRFPHYD
ncbi:MAG: flagellar biosynthesis protein FlgM [Thermoleophilia bacterium]|nr:flagellar biosynthesis protein FlgM [Thermoleophilia bacterium]